MDEPELPPLPRKGPAIPPLTRKRTHTEYEINTSSDPALFSSDDHKEASAEIYTSKRCKQKWTGTWWGDRLRNTSTRRKRSFKRNYDSGIFMGSEGTDTSLEDEFLADKQALGDTAACGRGSSPIFESSWWSKTKKVATLPEQTQLVSSVHYQAVAMIQRCLEEGSENVDLSSLYLETLPSEISLLKSLTKHNRISDPPASQEGYASIEAKLRLYLANNSLRIVPLPVLELESLRLLSLRHNNLTHIPAGLRRLVNLQSLNVSGNNLKYLPFEIVELFHHHRLVELIADPNPWEEWLERDEGVDEVSLTQQKQNLLDFPRYVRVHTGKSTLFHANGTDHVEFKASSAVESARSRAPHLTELVLRRLHKIPELSSIDSAIIEELPETAQYMISEAQDAQAEGGRRCTKCHTDIVMPRKRWLEWWSVEPALCAYPGRSLPFLRQQCHELCDGDVDAWTAKHKLV